MTQSLMHETQNAQPPVGGKGDEESDFLDRVATGNQEMQHDWSERCTRWTGVRSEWLDIDGLRVHVLRADGPAHGSPQLLLHGLGGAATNWLEVIGELTRHGPVVAPDLPGFGRTQPLEHGRVGAAATAEFLVRLLDELGWEEATVHGNSLGGMLAVHLASVAPRRVSRLVLTAPALPTSRTGMRRISLTTLARFAPFALPGIGGHAMRLVSVLSPEQQWQQSERYIHGDAARVAREVSDVGLEDATFGRDQQWRGPAFVAAAESLVRALLVPGELLQMIATAELPVLVIWGDADRLVGHAVIDNIARLRPDWDLKVLPSVGHCPMLEAPQEFVEAASSWINEEIQALHAIPAAA